eukprot:9473574-Pyramimonas_sp.AAC.1
MCEGRGRRGEKVRNEGRSEDVNERGGDEEGSGENERMTPVNILRVRVSRLSRHVASTTLAIEGRRSAMNSPCRDGTNSNNERGRMREVRRPPPPCVYVPWARAARSKS